MINKTDIFIQKARTVHGNMYDYSMVEYVNSTTPVSIKCPNHGVFLQKPVIHYSLKCGCPACSTERKKQTCLEKYGVEYYTNREKYKQTNVEKYGVDNPRKTLNVKNTIKQTCLEKYGVEYYTNREKYKQTNVEKYGVEYYTNREKYKQTCLDRYGVDNPQQNKEIQEKTKQTNLDRYGSQNYKQQHLLNIIPLIKNYNWLFDQYIIQDKTALQISQENDISDVSVGNYLRFHEIAIKQTYKTSFKANQWLNQIEQDQNIQLIREWSIPTTRYTADGYCQETNTIYEFYGDYWHGNPEVFDANKINESTNCLMGELYQQTINKEIKIKELQYNLISVWEKNYTN